MKTLRSAFQPLALAALIATTAPALADDARIWTSRAGSVLEASFVKLNGEEVTLLSMKDRREIRLKVGDLSLADRQYLTEVASADKSILTLGDLGVPEKEAKIDKKSFKKLDQRVSLGGESSSTSLEAMETEHFLIAWAGRRVGEDVVGEIAERLWHGMAFHHMNFRRDWGDKRRLVLLIEDSATYTDLGTWYQDVLTKKNVPNEMLAGVKTAWDKSGAQSLYLPEDLISKYKLHAEATLFNMQSKDGGRQFKKVFTPFPTHVLAGDLLEQQMGGISNIGQEGSFAIKVGHAFFKEIKLAGRTDTHLLDVGGSAGDEISSKSGFEDGSSWARSLRSEVKKGKIKPSLAELYAIKRDTLTPAQLVLVYSFANYLQSTQPRVAAFATLVRRVESNNTIPIPEELAKIYGFPSAAALETDWIAYINSPEFK